VQRVSKKLVNLLRNRFNRTKLTKSFLAYFKHTKWKDIRLQCFRLVGAGLATISLGVLVWVFGTIFNGLFNAAALNPSLKNVFIWLGLC